MDQIQWTDKCLAECQTANDSFTSFTSADSLVDSHIDKLASKLVDDLYSDLVTQDNSSSIGGSAVVESFESSQREPELEFATQMDGIEVEDKIVDTEASEAGDMEGFEASNEVTQDESNAEEPETREEEASNEETIAAIPEGLEGTMYEGAGNIATQSETSVVEQEVTEETTVEVASNIATLEERNSASESEKMQGEVEETTVKLAVNEEPATESEDLPALNLPLTPEPKPHFRSSTPLSNSKWKPGDLVWAKYPGYPWWPAKVPPTNPD
jgi:hypothetical protein